MTGEFPSGTVWLVGAGPGDPDLLTRKAERLIRSASLVIHDALVGPEVLDLVPPSARRVYAGKRAGRHAMDQCAISGLIVEAALAGERVVRLKGGDPVIFGRASEELDACRTAEIAVRICPGITAASAAAAGLGCSLTSRGLSRRLTFVTARTAGDGALDFDWSTLADRDATLAVYMGKGAAGTLSRKLLAAGLPAETPAALIENATLPGERQVLTRLDLLPFTARAVPGTGPVLLLIGAALGEALVPAGRLAVRGRSHAREQIQRL